MTWLRPPAVSALTTALMLVASAAHADTILLLPTRGTSTSSLPPGSVERETRAVLAQLGHQLVADSALQTAVQQVADGTPDTGDEYGQVAEKTSAGWVVVPTLSTSRNKPRLELTAFEASGKRMESVARELDASAMHQQILEMATVLVRPEGVGTGALPWEHPGVRPAPAQQEPPAASPEKLTLTPLVGAGLGISSALSRPEGAAGSSTSMWGAVRAGLGLGSSLELALSARSHVSGPRATVIDGAGRYTFALDPQGTFRVGPEIGAGAFLQRGGAKETTLLLRVTAVASVRVAGPVSVEASVGEVSWIPASSGTLVLGGGAVYGVARF